MQSKPISITKVVLYGLLTWLIPFALSFLLVGRDGQPIISTGVFKSLMIVVGSGVGTWLLVRVFRLRPAFKLGGLSVGILWFGINVGLDLLILIPLTKMALTDYFGEIALRYLVIPIMSVAIDTASGSAVFGDGMARV